MSIQPEIRCEFKSKDLILRLDTTLVCDTGAIDSLIDEVMVAVTDTGCAAGKEFQVRLAMEEALINAIEHGCGGDPTKEIQCSVCCDEERGMLIVIRDPGPGFDPASIPSPVIGENLFKTRGRGIYLINELVDEVRFERGGTEIHMRID
ncbi:ATP-binding protein [Gemmatimonadota bacterium]